MCRRKLLAQAVLALAGLAVASLAIAEPATSRAGSGSLTSAMAPATGTDAGPSIKIPPAADVDALMSRGRFQLQEVETLRTALGNRTLSFEGLRELVQTRETQLRTRGVMSPLAGALTVMLPNEGSVSERRGSIRSHAGAASTPRADGQVRIGNIPGDVVSVPPVEVLGGASNCCFAHGGLGCDDPGCEAIVCGADSFCCSVAWDGLCANAANANCAICMGAAPPNDLCADAELITVGSLVVGTTGDATADPEAPGGCGTTISSPGVWYKINGTGNSISITTCPAGGGGANYDTKLSVYCGDCTEFFCVTGNDDSCATPGDPFKSTVTWCSAPGVEYHVLVHGFFAQGNFTLNVTDGPACNNPPSCTPCIVDCPPGGIAENEPNCGLPTDSVNGGCNYPACDPPIGDCASQHGPGCSDPACEALVCAADPFCCSVFWDGLCVNAALALCCQDVTFLLTPIACGQTVCGSGAWNPAIGFRDTDWFEFTIDEAATVSWTVEAEFTGNGFFLTPTCPPTITDIQTFQPCVPNTMTSACARSPGTYWGFVAPVFGDAVVCPKEYTVTLGCEPICGPSGCGPCDVFALLQLLVPPGRQDVISSHPCFGAPVPVSPSADCCETVNNIIDILPGVVDGDHSRLDFTHPCFVP